jgi:transcriptional regulator GlxA family with amidase domain
MIFAHSDAPLNVTLLLFPGLSLLSLAATLDPMRGANRVLGRPAYCWKLNRSTAKRQLRVAGCRFLSTALSILLSDRTRSS